MTVKSLFSMQTKAQVLKAVLLLAAALFPLCAEEITFRADSMTGVAGSKTSRTTLSGNAFVKTASMEITADSIELDGDDFRFITASGMVTGKNTKSQMDFTCGRMTFDRETELARLEDSVNLVDKENDVTIDAQLIEYNQTSEIAVMQIDVTLKQKDNTCTSAYAVYRKQAQMLEMSGNPKIVQGDDTFRAQEITLNLDTQEITLDGRVSGTVSDSKKTEEAPAAAPGAGESSSQEKTQSEDSAAASTGADSASAESEKAAGETAAAESTAAADSAAVGTTSSEVQESTDLSEKGAESSEAQTALEASKSKKWWEKKK